MNLIEKILYESTLNNYVIYCDMDGVLTDFVKGYQKLTGKKINNYVHIDDWEQVDNSDNFWSSLEWMPDGKILWNYIKKYKPNILSSPSDSTTAVEQKEEWLQRIKQDMGKMIFVQKEEKQRYASPTHILIDDYKKNIEQWRHNNGIGILHTSAANTISQLKKLGL